MAGIESALQEAGIEVADVEARWIIETAAGRSRAELLIGPPLHDEVVERAHALAARRAAGEPLQYVTGTAGFRRLELAVGPGVLVPRPETELVAGRAMQRLPVGGVVVDAGTGSGAIALSIADERPDARVVATELSDEAMVWAERNIGALGQPVELIHCDLLSGLPAELRASVDVIVSNPPYVAAGERVMLPEEVVRHEPHQALFSGDDGLAVIARLAAEARRWLRPTGWLVTEMGERQGEDVRRLLEEAGYEDIAVLPDLAGRDRIAEGRSR